MCWHDVRSDRAGQQGLQVIRFSTFPAGKGLVVLFTNCCRRWQGAVNEVSLCGPNRALSRPYSRVDARRRSGTVAVDQLDFLKSG